MAYSVTAIGERSFQNSSDLLSVIIPGSVREIGSSVFFNCRNLN
ncbi:MAG: leucine-rich repeat protein [Bacteroidales bacterium]|nr:leucine-rich repeat protein [Bacteroidales bacterium]